MVVYLFLDVNAFRGNDVFATNVYRKKPLAGFIPDSEVLFLKNIKSVNLNSYYFGVSVCVLILSKFLMILII